MERRPPIGVRLSVDIEAEAGPRGVAYKARARWIDPVTGRRVGLKRSHTTLGEAERWLESLEIAAATGIDPGQTLATLVATIGDRWARAIDRTSTYDPYSAGLRLRVLPKLGHLPIGMITAGLIDRAIDDWELLHGRSTVKNTVSVLVLVLDEAVRDGLLPRNPAKDRARRRTAGRAIEADEPASPRDLALPDVETLNRLVESVDAAGGHDAYGDTVTVLATTALRISEVAGLRVGDIDLAHGLIHVVRQTYPGRGGLVTKQTKGRRKRIVPIIAPLRPLWNV